MPDIAETDSGEMPGEDRGSACPITRAPAAAHRYRGARRDDPAVILTAGPGALRELIRAGCLARPVPGEAAP